MKKYVSLLLAVILVFSAVPLNGTVINADLFGAKAQAADTSVFNFKLNEDEMSYTVTGLNKTVTGTLTVPATYNGMPVTKIGNSAFYNSSYSKFTSVEISYGIKEIGEDAFYGKSQLLDVTIPDSVTIIGNWAFGYCDALSEITIPDSVTTIDYDAFSGCSALTKVTIGSGVKTIGSYAFNNCNNIKSVYINDVANWCGISFGGDTSNPLYYAQNETSLYLNGKPLVDLVIPDGVKAISANAFINCKGIKSVTFPDGLKTIGAYAFSGCKNISQAVIPDSVSSIGSYCFHSNTVLYCGCQSRYAGTYNTTHNFSTEWTVEISPTCTETGIKSHRCIDCGQKTDITEIGATGHKLDTEWTVDKKATAKAAGSKSHHCTVCGAKKDVTAIPRLVPGTVKLKKVTNDLKGVKITWSAVSGADNYIVYRKSGSSGYKTVKTVSGSSTSYVDTTAKSGTKYTYTVRAKNISGSGSYNKTGLSIYYIAVPKTIKAKNVAAGVKVSWSKVTGAKGYEVLRKNSSGKWTKVATIKKQSTVSYTDTKASNGAYYYYTVVPYNGKTKSAEKLSSKIMFLSSPEIKTIKSTANGIYLKWTKNTKASYYKVYRKTGSGSYSCIGTTYYTDGYDTTVRGKKYTYYVQAYYNGYESSHKNSKSCTDRY